MQKGEIIEEGNHDALIELRGIYFNLIEQQSLKRTDLTMTDDKRQLNDELNSTAIEVIEAIDENTDGKEEEQKKTEDKVNRNSREGKGNLCEIRLFFP